MSYTHSPRLRPNGEMSPNADRWIVERNTGPTCASARGMVGGMEFTLDDFKTYIGGLRKPDWKKIFATVIADHHEMFVRLSKR
jgi:hypothetical protein